MRKLVGKRVIKTGFAVSIALMISSLLGFDSTFAGVVSLIGLKETTKKSFQYGTTLIFGSFIALIIGLGLVHLTGNNPLAFGLGTIVTITLLVTFRLYDGLILSVIVMYHVLENFPTKWHDFFQFTFHEISVILIGIITSVGINFLFPQKHHRYLEKKIEEIYVQLSDHLSQIAKNISDPKRNNIETALLEKERKSIRKLIEKAEISNENIINEKEKEYYKGLSDKLKILKKLLFMLEDITRETNRLEKNYLHSETIAKAFTILKRIQRFPEQTSASTYKRLFYSLKHLHEEFKDSPLPESRIEFEDRSSLYHLYLHTMEYADELFLIHNQNIMR